jgi:hypothetical protein
MLSSSKKTILPCTGTDCFKDHHYHLRIKTSYTRACMNQFFWEMINLVRLTVIRSTESKHASMTAISFEKAVHLPRHLVPTYVVGRTCHSSAGQAAPFPLGPTSRSALPHTETCWKGGHYRGQLRQGLTVELDTRKLDVRHCGSVGVVLPPDCQKLVPLDF